MQVFLKEGIRVNIEPANENYVESYMEFIKDLASDDDSYVIVNYSGLLPDIDGVRERSKLWNKGNISMHFALLKDRVIGYCGQKIGPTYGNDLQPHVSEIWYAVSRDFRGSGLIYPLIFESLKNTDVKYVQAYVDTRNVKSSKLMENIGFKNMGKIGENILDKRNNILRDDYYFRGKREEALKILKEKIDKRGLIINF